MVDVVDGVETVGRMLGIKGPQKRTSKLQFTPAQPRSRITYLGILLPSYAGDVSG
jgi:hypothetical protein